MIVIAGRFNYSKEVRFWEVGNKITGWSNANTGDYALVHNNGGFDLVEIAGIMVTDEKYLKSLGVPYGHVTQKVIMFIPKKYLE